MRLRLIDGFPRKTEAKNYAKDLREQGIQYVRVKPISQGNLKWGVYVGGRNSTMY